MATFSVVTSSQAEFFKSKLVNCWSRPNGLPVAQPTATIIISKLVCNRHLTNW